MIHYKKALLELKKNKIKIYSEKVSAEDSINRISAVNLNSPNNYPAANNSSFDGYAINSKETKNLTKKKFEKFKILKTIAAGDNPNIKKVPKYSISCINCFIIFIFLFLVLIDSKLTDA